MLRAERLDAQVPGVGVLLAIPALAASGVLRLSRELYGEIGPTTHRPRVSRLAGQAQRRISARFNGLTSSVKN